MDARRRHSSSPAAAGAALRLLLLCPMLLLGSRAAAATGGDAGMTELQKHAAFFDSDKDGVVSFSETYNAFRDFGFGITASTVSATFINGFLGPKTRPENETSRLSVYIENIHKGIHGSDSGAYDAQGRFVPEKFDAIFSKHGKTVPDALTSAEVDELISANREPSDYAGWAGASAEWKILYSIGKDKDGLLRKEDARGVYDGSLFAKLVQEKRRS
ncbi:probable peroxygenase 5 [Brachypodium distachyon]|uniref:EF-hand domain-containing protein n=1 Tax=Brachypodium distachyon TaxID=15368 RepID=A0A2K2D5E4_BRADI|nr:probable peroxygenase 5 [Brachypodium distachyon]PNT69512.1 hypothetical protein BRADI_3g56811v3 [Brachypodium distachyon]|eukprot:XP_024318265.1 probable peroxygenase 5 [Brachypodium distachyon]